MAASVLGAQLTSLHSDQQVALRANVIREVVRLFPSLDLSSFEAVDRSWPALEAALRALIAEQYGTSAGLSVNYYDLFRAAEGVPGASTPRLAAPLVAEQVEISLRVTGPYTAKHLIAVRDRQVAAKTLTRLSGSVSRLVAAGGRDSLVESMAADKRVLGYARVLRGRSCAFCRMLASRGHVYKSEASAEFKSGGSKYHDLCDCTAEPTFSRDSQLPAQTEAARRLWDETTAGLKGKDAVNAFRRAVERPAA
jgi:hypothetical protein